MEGRLKPASPITQLCLQLRAMCDCVVRGCRRTDLTLLRWMGPPCHSLSTMGWIEHTTEGHLPQPPSARSPPQAGGAAPGKPSAMKGTKASGRVSVHRGDEHGCSWAATMLFGLFVGRGWFWH